MIDLRHLKHALALAEYGNFAKAADACCITQSALTKSIQSLEESLGAILFDRSCKPVAPTEIGRLVLRHSSALDSSVRELLRDVRLAKGIDIGEITIGVGLFGGASLVAPVVARLCRQFPKLRIKVRMASWSDLPVKARAREADIIVIESGTLREQSDFDAVPLLEHQTFVVCRAGHPLLSQAAVTPGDLFRYPLIAPDYRPAQLDRICANAPDAVRAAVAAGDALAVQCDSASFLKEIVLDSDALAAMHSFIVARELASGELQRVPVDDLGLRAQFSIAWLTGRSLSPAAQRFVELMIAYDRELYQRFQPGPA